MSLDEILFGILAILLLIVAVIGPLVALILVFVLLRRVRQLGRRLEQLELGHAAQAAAPAASPLAAPVAAETVVTAEVVEVTPPTSSAVNWELLIGRKGLGWVAVILLLFGTAFFLRYAYENQWIGPLGRVAVGLLIGLVLTLAGFRYHRRGWRIFSQMLSSGGVVTLFLAVFSAFGFYHLIPQRIAGVFLMVVILEAALLAVLYRAPTLAWMSLIGGLLTPVLMRSEVDQYQSLFTYLIVLNSGVLLLVGWRRWGGLTTLALLGTQGLFWGWYAERYHPEKLDWAIGFQATVFALFVAHSLISKLIPPRRTSREHLGLVVLNACLGFSAAYVLLREDYREWLGLLAIAMATLYTALGRLVLRRSVEDGRLLLAALAVAVGFSAWAFPLQSRAEWVAFGWAAEAAALIWFGLRVNAVPLRAIAIALLGAAVARLLLIDTPHRALEPHLPILNDYALPALGVTGCLLISAGLTHRFLARLGAAERILAGLVGIGGVLLLWFVLSVDTHSYLRYLSAWASENPEDAQRWRWLSQMLLSALWAVYALAVLTIGFWRRLPALRWTALAIFAVTIVKVFVFDMAGLREFYRILAFFIVAMLLGLAGWAYQRMQPDRQAAEAGE